MSDQLFEQALQVELVKRIDAVSAYTDDDFGRITYLEWAAFIVLGLFLPLFCVFWAAA